MGSWRCFLLRRLRSAAELSADELWLSVRAIGWLAIARVTLATLGFPRVRRALDARPSPNDRSETSPAAVRRAVMRAARTLPGSDCLPQAVAAYALLRGAGQPAELTIGVRRGAERAPGPLDAHAWVHSGSFLVTGDAGGTDLAAFTELARFRGGL